MKNIYKILILIILLGIIACIVIFFIYFSKTTEPVIDVEKGKVSKIEDMAHLCTIDVYSEVPVLDTLNNKVIFAVQKQQGSISFDMDALVLNNDADTIKVILPPEIIDIKESTKDNSWEVIDTKSLSMFGSSNFSDSEESEIKAKLKDKAVKLLYENGTVERARKEAVENLTAFLEVIYRKPVIVTDPTPKGVAQ